MGRKARRSRTERPPTNGIAQRARHDCRRRAFGRQTISCRFRRRSDLRSSSTTTRSRSPSLLPSQSHLLDCPLWRAQSDIPNEMLQVTRHESSAGLSIWIARSSYLRIRHITQQSSIGSYLRGLALSGRGKRIGKSSPLVVLKSSSFLARRSCWESGATLISVPSFILRRRRSLSRR